MVNNGEWEGKWVDSSGRLEREHLSSNRLKEELAVAEAV